MITTTKKNAMVIVTTMYSSQGGQIHQTQNVERQINGHAAKSKDCLNSVRLPPVQCWLPQNTRSANHSVNTESLSQLCMQAVSTCIEAEIYDNCNAVIGKLASPFVRCYVRPCEGSTMCANSKHAH